MPTPSKIPELPTLVSPFREAKNDSEIELSQIEAIRYNGASLYPTNSEMKELLKLIIRQNIINTGAIVRKPENAYELSLSAVSLVMLFPIPIEVLWKISLIIDVKM